jgi:hypothetical protein
MSGECSTHGENRYLYGLLVRKPEVKRPLGRPRYRWGDNVKIDLRGMGWDGMGWYGMVWYGMAWMDPTQDRDQWRALVKMLMNIQVPYNVELLLSSCTTGGFSRKAQLHAVSEFTITLYYQCTFSLSSTF